MAEIDYNTKYQYLLTLLIFTILFLRFFTNILKQYNFLLTIISELRINKPIRNVKIGTYCSNSSNSNI